MNLHAEFSRDPAKRASGWHAHEPWRLEGPRGSENISKGTGDDLLNALVVTPRIHLWSICGSFLVGRSELPAVMVIGGSGKGINSQIVPVCG